MRRGLTIRRDGAGVPYISAEVEHDGWFGLGFCHGQDRALQLEILLRAGRGTVAALVGEEGLGIDRISRRIGFRRVAERQLPRLRPEIRAQLAAYAAGINAAFELDPRPHELAILGRGPTRWEPADVHAYAVIFCFALAANWDAELMRLKVLLEDGPEAVAALEPRYLAELPSSQVPDRGVGEGLDHLAADLTLFEELLGHGVGSNAWAVGPGKTASGRPILANDPHLMAQAPSLNYLAQIRAGELEVAGASWVGLPAFGPGHNGFAAWGVTAAHADNTDLFLEEVGPDGASLREGDGFVACERRDEWIEVRGGETVRETVLVGPRGPILVHAPDAAAPDVSFPRGANALSIAATWLSDRPYCGLYRASDARSFEGFRELFREGAISSLSTVYADADGHVGWCLAVEIPRREAGAGLVPLPGWRMRRGLSEVVPFEALPWSLDPERGFVCTANNAPTPNDETPFLGADFLDGYRQARIAEVLAGRDDWDRAGMAELQLDTLSLPWRGMRAAVLALSTEGGGEDARVAQTMLRHWDGQLTSRSLAASIYALFLGELIDRLVSAKAPKAAAWAKGRAFTPFLPHSTIATRRTGHIVKLLRERPAEVLPAGEAGDAVLRAALAAAVAHLRAAHGDDPAAWAWGKVRPLTLVHPFGKIPVLGAAFDLGPFPGAGDNTTVNQGGLDFAHPLTAGQVWFPALRSVIDVGRWDEARFAVLGGQSGNPLSPHYDDQVGAWQSAEGVVVAWSEAAIAARTEATLTLRPL